MLPVAVLPLKVAPAKYQPWNENLLAFLSDGTVTPKELLSPRLASHYPLAIQSVVPVISVH